MKHFDQKLATSSSDAKSVDYVSFAIKTLEAFDKHKSSGLMVAAFLVMLYCVVTPSSSFSRCLALFSLFVYTAIACDYTARAGEKASGYVFMLKRHLVSSGISLICMFFFIVLKFAVAYTTGLTY